MNATRVGTRLAHRLSDGFTVSHRPDHPFLLDSPDLLVAKEGRLAAVFILKAAEVKQPDRLLARLAFSRLALPSHTLCLLVMGDEPLEPHHAVVRADTAWEADFASTYPSEELSYPRNFDAVFEPTDGGEIEKYLRDPSPSRRADPVPQEIRSHHHARASAFLAATRAAQNGKRRVARPERPREEMAISHAWEPVSLRSWASGRERLSRGDAALRQRGADVIASAELVGRGSLPAKLEPYCISIVKHDYRLDKGVPYLQHIDGRNLLLVDEFPVGRLDPEKPVRAAAFAGWAMAQVDGAEEVDEYMELIAQQLELVQRGQLVEAGDE